MGTHQSDQDFCKEKDNDALDNFSGVTCTLAGRLYRIPRGCVVHPRAADHRPGGAGNPIDRRETGDLNRPPFSVPASMPGRLGKHLIQSGACAIAG